MANAMLPELNRQFAEHVQRFFAAIQTHSNPNSFDAAILAMNSANVMVCLGPSATKDVGVICAFIKISSFCRRYVVKNRTVPLGPAHGNRLFEQIWAQLEDPEEYLKLVEPNEDFKSKVPNRFWTVYEDIKAAEADLPMTSRRLQQFLGVSKDDDCRGIIIGIGPQHNIEMNVPTGWDALANPYFRENTFYDAADSSTHVGWTLDIGDATLSKRGAREVVTRPIPSSITQMLARK